MHRSKGSRSFSTCVARNGRPSGSIKSWVMSWGSKAEVIEPQSLREEIRMEAEGMAEKYAKLGELEESVKA